MGNHRSYLRTSTKEMINENATLYQMNDNGQIVDPNTSEVISGKSNDGHVNGMENRGFVKYSDQAGMSQHELNDITNNAGLFQKESESSNKSHQYEESDSNATALNTANYSYLENPKYQENTYINPPNEEGGAWTVTVENINTGKESQVGTFNPDIGEVTAESKAAMESAVSSCHSNSSLVSDNSMSDFGTENNTSNMSDGNSIGNIDGNNDGNTDGNSNGNGE